MSTLIDLWRGYFRPQNTQHGYFADEFHRQLQNARRN